MQSRHYLRPKPRFLPEERFEGENVVLPHQIHRAGSARDFGRWKFIVGVGSNCQCQLSANKTGYFGVLCVFMGVNGGG
jgi:hypothetical protein